jgi:hypothetical protein
LSREQIDRRKLIDETLCSPTTDICYYHDCRSCGNQLPSNFLISYYDGDKDDITEWTSCKQTNKRVALQQITGSVSLLLDEIDEQWKTFLSHHYYTKTQQSYIAELRKVRIISFSKYL